MNFSNIKLILIGLSFLSPLMTVQSGLAQTSPVTRVNAISLGGLSNYSGQYLTAYYALATKASLSVSEAQLTLREVKHKVTLKITQDTVELPAVDIPRHGIFMAYNFLVFVIHSENQFVWINANRTIPDGESLQGSTQYLRIDALEKEDFDLLRIEQGVMGKIKYSFGSSFRNSIILFKKD